jgi:hypothetical protein
MNKPCQKKAIVKYLYFIGKFRFLIGVINKNKYSLITIAHYKKLVYFYFAKIIKIKIQKSALIIPF